MYVVMRDQGNRKRGQSSGVNVLGIAPQKIVSFLFVGIEVAFYEHTLNVYICGHHAFTDLHDLRAPPRKFTALPQVLFVLQFRK